MVFLHKRRGNSLVYAYNARYPGAGVTSSPAPAAINATIVLTAASEELAGTDTVSAGDQRYAHAR